MRVYERRGGRVERGKSSTPKAKRQKYQGAQGKKETKERGNGGICDTSKVNTEGMEKRVWDSERSIDIDEKKEKTRERERKCTCKSHGTMCGREEKTRVRTVTRTTDSGAWGLRCSPTRCEGCT